MPLFELFFIAVGLSADAFAVSVSNGLGMKKVLFKKALPIAAAFGISQAVMPFFGYLLGAGFTDFISEFDHYIALVFLGFIGGKMLLDGIRDFRRPAENDKETEKELKAAGLIMQAVATSIDALIVGVSFVAIGMDWNGMLTGVAVIGVITFTLSLAGVYAGKKFGDFLGSRAVIAGGVILIGIGVKVFIEHMFFGG